MYKNDWSIFSIISDEISIWLLICSLASICCALHIESYTNLLWLMSHFQHINNQLCLWDWGLLKLCVRTVEKGTWTGWSRNGSARTFDTAIILDDIFSYSVLQPQTHTLSHTHTQSELNSLMGSFPPQFRHTELWRKKQMVCTTHKTEQSVFLVLFSRFFLTPTVTHANAHIRMNVCPHTAKRLQDSCQRKKQIPLFELNRLALAMWSDSVYISS